MAELEELEVEDSRVFLRLDLNVPVREGRIRDDWRIKKSLQTVEYLLSQDAERIIIGSHLGRPGGKKKEELSLKPVAEKLSELLEEKVLFAKELSELPESGVVLLENLRFHKGERSNSSKFCKNLKKTADFYINDAFGTVHRRHASTYGLPKLYDGEERAHGLLIREELSELDLEKLKKPLHVVLGGAKTGGKIVALKRLLEKAENVCVGGAMVFTFLEALGLETGKSLVDEEAVSQAKKLLEEYEEKIFLPSDVVVAEDEESEVFTVDYDKIPPGMKGFDIGAQSIEEFFKEMEDAESVFWNGPLGKFEIIPFDQASKKMASHLAKSSKDVVVAGGETAKAVNDLKLEMFFRHVSTGGGSALDYVSGKSLPCVEVLRENS